MNRAALKPIKLENEAATLQLGSTLAKILRPSDVICLTGNLGAGKTTLARGVIQSLCPGIEVPSPTYTLVQIYDAPGLELWHSDLYRLERADDILELGLLEAFDEAACLIEWPDRLGPYLPENYLDIEITFDNDSRCAHITASSSWKERIRDITG